MANPFKSHNQRRTKARSMGNVVSKNRKYTEADAYLDAIECPPIKTGKELIEKVAKEMKEKGRWK